MFAALDKGDEVFRPSAFWQALNARNMADLRKSGLDNFKRTLARTYFTFTFFTDSAQFRFLARHTRLQDWPAVLNGALSLRDDQLSLPSLASLSILTKMLWLYATRRDSGSLLQNISEPVFGSPFDIRVGGKLVSQDLANSVLEYQSICSDMEPGFEPGRIVELGAGYGRNAFVFLKVFPKLRYVIVDIPPALYVSQQYLTQVFAGERAFLFREFESYSEIAEEYEVARLAFLLPHQARLLPEKSCDAFVNISSLHEMLPKQIEAYLELVDRVTRGWFYMKQWKASRNVFDGVVIREDDYPIPQTWRRIYKRPAAVQTKFFEALYRIP
jgi:putative sugar O-methyltransferase